MRRCLTALAVVLQSICTLGDAQQPAVGDVYVTYPPPNSDDALNLRGCPLEWDPGDLCSLIGTRGPVKKISWRDERLQVLDGYIQFDRQGRLNRVCSRGRIDFQGWNCREVQLEHVPDVLQTQLDSRGRLIRRLRFQFDKSRFVTCSYDDDSVPRTSECNDGVDIHRYSYDSLGRPIAYRRRRSPAPDETPEHARSLEQSSALDVRYIYTDDKYGNWSEFQIVQDESTSDLKTGNPIFRRTIEYY